MATADSDQLRSLGRQLGEYVARQGGISPAPASLQGVVADLTAGHSDLQAPLRDLVSRQSFAALLPHARSSGGLIQRDALIQEISRVYHPDVLMRVEEVLNGFLDASGGIATSLMHDQVPVQIEKQNSQAKENLSSYLPVASTSSLPTHSNRTTNSAGPSDRKLLGVAVAIVGVFGLAAIGFQSITSQAECSTIADQLEPLAADSSEFKRKITEHKSECADDSRFLIQQSILSDHLGQPQEALTLVNKSIKINPEDATAYYWQGSYFFALGDYKNALLAYDRSLELVPGDSRTTFERGATLSWLNRGSEAVSAYTEAIKLDPANSYAYRERGREKLARKEYPSALQDVSKAIQIDASDEHAYHVRAMIKTWLDDFEGACADIKKSKQLGLKEGFKGRAIDAEIAEICADAST